MFLVLLFVIGISSSALADISTVRKAFASGDTGAVVGELFALARGGDIKAQDFLGDAYFNGRGVDKNFSIAWHWYKRAAVQENAQSQYKLGYMYQHGLGVEVNPKEARKWYAFAADKGVTAAQMKLGLIYFYDGGADREKAVDLLEKAAANGVPRAFKLLSDAASQGSPKARKALAELSPAVGCNPAPRPPDLGKSATFGYNAMIRGDYETPLNIFNRLADRNDPVGLFGMGLFYQSKKSLSRNLGKALKEYRMAAKQGSLRARLMLDNISKIQVQGRRNEMMAMQASAAGLPGFVGQMERKVSRNGTAFGVTLPPLDGVAGKSVRAFVDRNFEKAFIGFKSLVDRGRPVGLYGLALMHQYGLGFKPDLAKAAGFYKAAAKAGYVPAQVNLGFMYYHGDGIARNYSKAFKWQQKAADKGSPLAQNMVGLMYFFGRGTGKDKNQAIKWFRRAAERQNAEAANNLGLALLGVRDATNTDKSKPIHLRLVAKRGYGIAAAALRETVFAYDDKVKGNAKPNYEEGLKWLRAAAERGSASARLNLGRIYNAGFFVGEDMVQSYKWLSLAVNDCDRAAGKELNTLAAKMSKARIAKAEWQILKEMKFIPTLSSRSPEPMIANAGTPKELTAIGIRYQFGRGVPKDYREAYKYYRAAAEKGYPKAQHNLAYMYRQGYGVAKNMKQAAVWYRKAADNGSVFAEKNLGIMYQFGYGVPQDDLEATKWYRKAAEKGNAKAQHNLAYMYREGRGVAKDMKQAAKWYLKAAEQGQRRAQKSLGVMYQFGRGITKDYKQAAKWYRKAADQGDVKAQGNLAYLYEVGLGVSKDYRQAAKWYRKAAEKGDARAQGNLGFLYFNGSGVEKNSAEAIKWTSLAIAKGYPNAYENLASMIKEDGFGSSAQYQKLAQEFMVKNRQRSSEVLNVLGLMYQYGKGVGKNKDEAKKWFKLAIRNGSVQGKKNLKELTRKKSFF